MKLVKNWKQIVLKSHSMWAFYLGWVFLWGADVIYLTTGVDTNPRVWILISALLIGYGIIGRIKDQGIADA